MDEASFRYSVVETKRFLLIVAPDVRAAVQADLGPEWTVASYGDALTGRRFDRVYVAQAPVTPEEVEYFDVVLRTKLPPGVDPILLS